MPSPHMTKKKRGKCTILRGEWGREVMFSNPETEGEKPGEIGIPDEKGRGRKRNT